MKIEKTLLKLGCAILGLIFILIIAAVLIFHLYGAKLMKMGIEIGGESALKVPVSVDDVSLSILGGNAGLKNLAIGNPPKKYEHEHLLTIGNGQIHLKTKSVLSDTIEIESILLENIEIVMEKEKLGFGNNIQDILNNLPADDEKPQQPEEPGKNLLIRKLEIRNATVNLKLLHIKGKFGTTPLPLDKIVLTDLGTDKKLNVAQLTGIILKALVGGIMEKGAGIIPQEILDPLGDTLKKLGDVAGKVLKETGIVVETGIEAGKEATEKVVEEGGKVLEESGKVLEEGGKTTEKIIEGSGKILEEGAKGTGDLIKGIGDVFKTKDKENEKKPEKDANQDKGEKPK